MRPQAGFVQRAHSVLARVIPGVDARPDRFGIRTTLRVPTLKKMFERSRLRDNTPQIRIQPDIVRGDNALHQLVKSWMLLGLPPRAGIESRFWILCHSDGGSHRLPGAKPGRCASKSRPGGHPMPAAIARSISSRKISRNQTGSALMAPLCAGRRANSPSAAPAAAPSRPPRSAASGP